jgi:hypothetical protein
LIRSDHNILWMGDACIGSHALLMVRPRTIVEITPEGHPPVHARLTGGTRTEDDACLLTFTATIPEAPNYTFKIAQLEVLRHTRSEMETPGDWDVTLIWGELDPQPGAAEIDRLGAMLRSQCDRFPVSCH